MKTLKILTILTVLLLQSQVVRAGWWDDFVDWAMSPVRPATRHVSAAHVE